MHNYTHKKLAETITKLDRLPEADEQFSEWITAEAHLAFLRENARSDEVVVYANADYTFVDSIVVPNELLAGMSRADLAGWGFDSYNPIASYSSAGGGKEMRIERGVRRGYEGHQNGMQLVFIRRFDFTLTRRESFGGWPPEPPEDIQESEEFFYHRKILPGYAAYTAGIQIIRPRRSGKAVQTDIRDGWFSRKDKKYAEFITFDWRNNRIDRISTDPGATTNYFDAKDNMLPYELSPAFFRPEVLSKYKTDRDKYTLGECDLTCRAAWHLRGIDVNEAGQVHAYICDLRKLPYEEQLHWLAYNEAPKASISERAYVNDFKGEFVHFSTPPALLLSVARRWHDRKFAWWTLRDEKLLDRVNTPLTTSRDEWAEAFMDLDKLVVEGFETSPIRQKLDAAQIAYKDNDRTIALLEKLLRKSRKPGEAETLSGLRTIHHLRSKLKGHVGGREADTLAREAESEHGSFADHFKHVCGLVLTDMER